MKLFICYSLLSLTIVTSCDQSTKLSIKGYWVTHIQEYLEEEIVVRIAEGKIIYYLPMIGQITYCYDRLSKNKYAIYQCPINQNNSVGNIVRGSDSMVVSWNDQSEHTLFRYLVHQVHHRWRPTPRRSISRSNRCRSRSRRRSRRQWQWRWRQWHQQPVGPSCPFRAPVSVRHLQA